MGEQNIGLDRLPTAQDYGAVVMAAEKPCHCSEGMKAGVKHGDEPICKPCAARQVLNGLTSLAEKL